MKYTIKNVGSPREWSSEKFGGTFYAYPLDLENENGHVIHGVEWSRKPDSDAPKVGDEIHGEIKGGPHGDKIKIDWDAMKGGSGGGSFSRGGGGKGNWQPDHERDPQKVARIARSHAITNAVAVLTHVPDFNASSAEAKKEKIVEWAGWIEGQVNGAGAAAQVTAQLDAKPAPAPPESTEYESPPAPAQTAADDIPF